MKKYFMGFTVMTAVTLAGFTGYALAQQPSPHLDTAIASLKTSIAEAIQCGGGGCKGARAEGIALMNQALAKLQAAKNGK